MNTNPLLSVIMPVYNAEHYVKESIESILNQTYSNFELIIINDGSTDNSAQIIKSFNDSRISFIENENNIGLIATLNKGFDLAIGKYIARMDADDISLPIRLEKQVEYLENNKEVSIYGSAYQEFNEKGKGMTIHFLSNNDELKSILLFNSCMGHPTVMFRTEFVKNHNIKYDFNYEHAEDYELWTRAIELTKFSNYPKVLLLYRLHDKQVSKSQIIGQQLSANKIRLKMLTHFKITPTNDELKIHEAIGSKELLKGLDKIIETEKWLKKLIEGNENEKYIKTEIFNRYLSIVFQDVCANASVGLRAFIYFNSSEIKIYSPKSIIFKLKFLIKCLIR